MVAKPRNTEFPGGSSARGGSTCEQASWKCRGGTFKMRKRWNCGPERRSANLSWGKEWESVLQGKISKSEERSRGADIPQGKMYPLAWKGIAGKVRDPRGRRATARAASDGSRGPGGSTAPKSEFRQISQFFAIFRDFCDFFQNFNVFRLKFSQNFSDFNEFVIFAKSGKFWKTFDEFWRKVRQKFVKNSSKVRQILTNKFVSLSFLLTNSEFVAT